MHVDAGHERHVEILVAQNVQAQHAFAECQVPVQRRQAAVHVGQQLFVHDDRNVVLEQGRLQRRIKVVYALFEQVRFHRRRQGGTHRPLVRLQRPEE